MNSELILNSDVLDIVFEKRNKLYGAYTLRKFYNNRLIKSIGITLAVVSILSAFTFIPEKKVINIADTTFVICSIGKIHPLEVKKKLPNQRIKSTISSQKKFLHPIIVEDKMKRDSMQEIKIVDLIGSTNVIVPGDGKPGIIGENFTAIEGGGGEGFVKLVPEIINIETPIDHPEVEPTYPGGINALRKFLERNLINPTEMEQGEMVAVHVKFVVGYDGKVQKFTVVKDGGNIFNNEVIRVLKKMPEWIPGKSKGQNVAVYFTIPIKFVPAD